MAGKRNISFIKNEEPSFIKAFKQKIGYKEGPTLESKREELHFEEEDRPEAEDEKPVVVVLRDGDLTAEEAEKAQKDIGEDEDVPVDGKIKFRKPSKRSSDKQAGNEEGTSAAKKSKEEGQKKKKSKEKKSNLLSFDEEEEEEDT